MHSYLLGQYEKSMPNDMTICEKLILSKKCGFDYLELSVDETDEKLKRLDFTKEEKNDLRHIIEETGQPIYSMCLSGHRKYPLGSEDPQTTEKSLEIAKKAVEFCADIGIRQIQVAGYDVYYEESTERTKERFLENLRKFVNFASRYGVFLGFETMENDFMNTCEKAMKYVNTVNSPYLNVYPDIGNIANAVKDPCKDIETARGHITAAHLKETLPGLFRDVPFGTGHTPYKEAIKKLFDMGARMYVLEFWYKNGEDPEKYVSFARKYIGDKFKAAGIE